MSKRVNIWVLIAGFAVGVAAVLLTFLGNPANMGFCIACFLRDIAGATKLHSAAVVQYVRPEIIGLVLGSAILSMATGEFKARAGSSPAVRFLLGGFVMIGALVFLGCPLRMVIRMGGGDLNAFVGLAGFAIGILIGIFFLKKGFSLKRSYNVGVTEGLALPGVVTALLILVIAAPGLFAFSQSGPRFQNSALLCSACDCNGSRCPRAEVPSVHGRRYEGCRFVSGFQSAFRVWRDFRHCAFGKYHSGQFPWILCISAADCTCQPVVESPRNGHRGMGQCAARRLSSQTADSGRRRKRRQCGDGVWDDRRRGLCA